MTLTPTLIRRARDLDADIKAQSKELKEIKDFLISQGAGEYEGTDGAKALVIFPAPSIKPGEEALRECKRLLTPGQWGKLFVEETTWTPTKAFREVAAAILKPDALADVIAACEKEGAPQVRLS